MHEFYRLRYEKSNAAALIGCGNFYHIYYVLKNKFVVLCVRNGRCHRLLTYTMTDFAIRNSSRRKLS